MPISLTEDFKTVVELQNNAAEILQQMQQTGRPVVITVKGKPAAVMLDAITYEEKLKKLNFALLVAEAEAQIRAGMSRPAEEFFEEFEREHKIPRSTRSARRK